MKKTALFVAITTSLGISDVAQGASCTIDGGNQSCAPVKVEEWKKGYSVCHSFTLMLNIAADCLYIAEGKYTPSESNVCQNITPVTEENYQRRVNNYVFSQLGPYTQTTFHDWGYKGGLGLDWGCEVEKIEKINGFPIVDYRVMKFLPLQERKVITHMNVRLGRHREVVCPTNYTKESKYINGELYYDCIANKPKIQNSCEATVGNPCSITTGNKTLHETDWERPNSPLKVKRVYGSLLSKEQAWHYNHQAKLEIGEIQDIDLNVKPQSIQEPNTAIVITRLDGSKIVAQRKFINNTITNEWFIDKDTNLQLSQHGSLWQLKNLKTGTVESYQNLHSSLGLPLVRIDYLNGQSLTYHYEQNRLIKVYDHLNQELHYEYNPNGQINSIRLPNGKNIVYSYDNLGRLSTVKRAGYGIKTYIYDEADKAPNDNTNLITGIIDENGKRYASYHYDNENRGISTEHAGATQKFTLNYHNSYTEVTDEYGTQRNYSLTQVSGSNRISRQSIGNKREEKKYDNAGNVIQEYKDGRITKYRYDENRNLQTAKIEGYGSDSRITLTEWDDNRPLKTKITKGTANPDGSLAQALYIESYQYDNHGNVLTKTITDPTTNQNRVWQYTYNINNQKLTETNPQGQTAKYDYDNKGNLIKHTDYQGLITVYSNYNLDGKPQTITSPTGQITKLVYDDAGRIISQSVQIITPTLKDISQKADGWIDFQNWWKKLFKAPLLPNPVKHDISKQTSQTAITTYQYDGVGQLITTTLPNGQTIHYQYDDAHRLIGMRDNLGNKTQYQLNPAGDITQTDSHDPQGVLITAHRQSYDTFGRLSEQTGNNGQRQNYQYDNFDNMITSNDALGRQNQNLYDVYNRKTRETDADGNRVQYTYNTLDQQTSITDSNGLTTSYVYNAFGDVLSVTSADTGTTSYQYNDKGQLIRQTDAENRIQNYTYDDKGRLSQITDNTGKVLTAYRYDDKGRIVTINDPSGQTDYQYNSNNQVIEKIQTTNGKKFIQRYHYTASGQLDEILYPSGQLVVYQYDKGFLTGVQVKTTDNQTVQLIDSIKYSATGISSYHLSQTKQTVSYQYDLDGRLTAIDDPVLQRQYRYDVANRITDLVDSKADIRQQFRHDRLDRLIHQVTGTAQVSYNYDKNSNRWGKTTASGTTYTLMKQGSNHYKDYVYDNSGKTLDDGKRKYGYNSAGRLETIGFGSVVVRNGYNGLGQRVLKTVNNEQSLFVYDEQGLLLSDGEREFVYLGNIPVAMTTTERKNEVLQIHTDHLGTPRAVTNAKNEKLWQWEGDAFGDVKPTINLINQPLRFAGQYADEEVGLFYNYFRFYDPAIGRYIENDPIDLAGGLNRYAYVNGNPLHNIDPTGEFAIPFPVIVNTVANIAIQATRIILSSMIRDVVKDSGVISDATCPPEQDPDKCKEIQTKIDSAVKRLKRGIRNEKLNKGKKGGTLGHYQNFLDTKVYLKRLIDEAIANGCYIDEKVYDMLDRKYPNVEE